MTPVRSMLCVGCLLLCVSVAQSHHGLTSFSAAPVPQGGDGLAVTERKKVVIVGAGWAGLGAAHALAKQGKFDVTLLEAGPQVGGLVSGWKTQKGRSVEVGLHGFWYPYRNIFRLVNEELKSWPFTEWTPSAQYSPNGLEVTSPIFQDLPRLPAPMGTFLYPNFRRLPVEDRLSALPLLYSMIDFDNSDEAWRKYDKMTARELFKQFGVSKRLYKEAFEPMLLVGLFAPGEDCSAAAALGMLYYFILAHQADFDVMWPRGTVADKIFTPWVEKIKSSGAKLETNKRVTDIVIDEERNTVVGVATADSTYEADAVIFSVGINGMKSIVRQSKTLGRIPEFAAVQNLRSIDVCVVRLYLDRKVKIPYKSNACFGFEETTGWTFFDLSELHDDLRAEEGTVLEADFYHANQYLAMPDEAIVEKVKGFIEQCVPAVAAAEVVDSVVVKVPQGVTHFSPGSYQHMLRGRTSVSNLFMSGDWIITSHGSFSQEKAYVTGLEAANNVVDQLGVGEPSLILPIEKDEPHIQAARSVNNKLREAFRRFPQSPFL